MKKPCSYTLVWWPQRSLHLSPFLKDNEKQSRNIWNIFNHSQGAIVSSKFYGKQKKQRTWSLFSTTKTEKTICRMSFTTERAAAKLIMWVKLQINYKSASVMTRTHQKSPNLPWHFRLNPNHLFTKLPLIPGPYVASSNPYQLQTSAPIWTNM